MFLFGVELIVASFVGGLLYESFQHTTSDESKKNAEKMLVKPPVHTPMTKKQKPEMVVINQTTLALESQSFEKTANDTISISTPDICNNRPVQINNANADEIHVSGTRPTMLSIRVNEVVCAIPTEQVQHIDYVESLTLLPFTPAPFEGLTHFNGQALLQINLATALGLEQQQIATKRLLVRSVQGDFALCVDEILDFSKTKTAENQTVARVLCLSEILPPGFKSKPAIFSLPQNQQVVADKAQQKLTVLLVASADKTIALLTHNIDHIQEMTGLQTLEGQNTQGELLIKVKDHLLPTHSLRKLFGLTRTDKPESFAVIMRSATTSWALLVQQVIALETIIEVYSSGTDSRGLWYVSQTGQIRELIDANTLANSAGSAARLWYVTSSGQVQELVEANNLLGKNTVPLTITISSPPKNSQVLQVAERLTTEGLQIYCGKGRYFLPLAMATRTLKDFNPSALASSRFPSGNRSNYSRRIPWINATAFLFGERSHEIDSSVLITLGNNRQILLGVDRIALSQSATTVEKWLKLDLPDPVRLFFDAGYYDAPSGQWILRLVTTIEFSHFPWAVKKSLVKAIIGWVDSAKII